MQHLFQVHYRNVHNTLLFLNGAEVRVLQSHLLLQITLIENLWEVQAGYIIAQESHWTSFCSNKQ